MARIKALIAMFIVVMVTVACGGPTDTEPPAGTTTTIAIAVDSEWQVPAGFSVVLPLTYKRVGEMLRNDPGSPPDLPEFSMSGEVAHDGESVRLVIIAYSDGVSTEARPKEVLTSWLKSSVVGGDFAEIVVVHRNGVQWAMSRGQAHGPAQGSPQGVIATVISEPETQRVWRLMCLVSSEVVTDEAANICEQVRDEFRPQSLTVAVP